MGREMAIEFHGTSEGFCFQLHLRGLFLLFMSYLNCLISFINILLNYILAIFTF